MNFFTDWSKKLGNFDVVDLGHFEEIFLANHRAIENYDKRNAPTRNFDILIGQVQNYLSI